MPWRGKAQVAFVCLSSFHWVEKKPRRGAKVQMRFSIELNVQWIKHWRSPASWEIHCSSERSFPSFSKASTEPTPDSFYKRIGGKAPITSQICSADAVSPRIKCSALLDPNSGQTKRFLDLAEAGGGGGHKHPLAHHQTKRHASQPCNYFCTASTINLRAMQII